MPTVPQLLRRESMLKLILLFSFALLAAIPDRAGAGVIDETGHGDRAKGPLRVNSAPRGSCGQCHNEGKAAQKMPKGLWRENDNELCYACHRETNFSGVYPGVEIYQTSRHGTDSLFVWPGPQPSARREAGAAGKCLNCHTPHGKRDRNGIIPAMLVAREEELCISCHDGSPASKDIAREVTKPYSHPVRATAGKHAAAEGSDPAFFSYRGGNRHAACSDCHNAHAVSGNSLPPTAPAASNRNARVSRIRVSNGPAGAMPMYEFRSAFDTGTPVLEYEICFKCHSSWTQQPPGQQDMAMLFNTNNASFHPVEGEGKSPDIDPTLFAGGRNAFSTIFCSDCHGSDDSRLRGPHGSQFPNILRRAYEARSTFRVTGRDELCFSCHNFDPYANPAYSTVAVRTRFRLTAAGGQTNVNGHAFHTGQKSVPCFACHDSHGSPLFPSLITVGRNPGLLKFSTDSNGGSCLTTCHTARSYVR